MSGDWQEPGASYIPERLKQQIAAKKRRQIVIRIALVIGVIAVFAIAFSFLAGTGQGPAPGNVTPAPTPATGTSPVPVISTTTPTAAGTSATSVPVTPDGASGTILSPALLAVQNETGIISYSRALAYLNDDFPASAFTRVSADFQTLSSGRQMYVFLIRPATVAAANASTTAYIDAVSGDPYTPLQEEATIMSASVRNSIADIFPDLHPDRVRVRYTVPASGQQLWNFTLIGSDAPLLTGSFDAVTGDLVSFDRVIPVTGRPSVAIIENVTAVKIAERYISDHNGPVSIDLTTEQYSPVGPDSAPRAGTWMFRYSRLVQDYPCDIDGFTVSVDSVSGEITGYERRWSDPEYAFILSPIPSVLKREATYTVLRKAQDTFPGLATGIVVISADVRWKDGHPAGTVPRPGSIRLAWKVVFDDELIRSQATP